MINLFGFLFYKAMPYLTRLPVLENYWQGSLGHYQNRYLLRLVNLIEGKTKIRRLLVDHIQKDRYHVTLFVHWLKPLKSSRVKQKLNRRLTVFFASGADNCILKLARSRGEILIPKQIFPGSAVQ